MIITLTIGIGAGGLGCPALQYLAAAGIGKIGILDDDIVSVSNLHRQIIYSMDDIGSSKAEAAASKLRNLNPDIGIVVHHVRLSNQNALEILEQYEVILDGTDNFASRYMINDACVLLKKPLVYGAISQYEGQVAVFNVQEGHHESINYRDLFPEPPKDGEVLNCAEAGVIGVLPGIIGTMQANETIKLITGIGKPLNGQVLTYNALNNSMYTFNLQKDNSIGKLAPQDAESFKTIDYNWFCGIKTDNPPEEIDIDQFNIFLLNNSTIIIDVREEHEQPQVTEFDHIKIPLSIFKAQMANINKDVVILFCQSGTRSMTAAKWLSENAESKQVYSLKGGITNWLRHQQSIV